MYAFFIIFFACAWGNALVPDYALLLQILIVVGLLLIAYPVQGLAENLCGDYKT
jgi:hypothetical protein